MGPYGSAPALLSALVLSMLVFTPEWRARVQAAGFRSALIGFAAILLLIAFIGFAGITYR